MSYSRARRPWIPPYSAVHAPICPFTSKPQPWLSTSSFLPATSTSTSTSTSTCLPIVPHRSVATARRTTKLLRPRPAPSAAAASKYRQPARDTIIFNPPPSAPSPYHTPPLFLPPEDPRRHLLDRSHAYANPYAPLAAGNRSTGSQPSIALSSSSKPSNSLSPGRSQHPFRPGASNGSTAPNAAPLPPPLKEPRQKTYRCSPADIAEIRRLRTKDPFVWTRKKLAEKFGCTEFFVGMCVPANDERMAWHEQNLDVAKERWGPKRTRARQDRGARKESWNRDA